ncbi:RxLR effector protein [Plasmodiophora brassicae]
MAPGCVSTGAAAVAAVLLVLACAPLAVDAAAAGDRQAVHGARTPPPRLDHIAIDMPPLVGAASDDVHAQHKGNDMGTAAGGRLHSNEASAMERGEVPHYDWCLQQHRQPGRAWFARALLQAIDDAVEALLQ